ncbi:hypothetical protein [Marinicellulosiphila megalodicopiae]|uniref:hypothetical protein n=1 Tax=Marinicellulosiphila megalodicopiae TaxID=2724896 RepID=UPI003BB1A7EE
MNRLFHYFSSVAGLVNKSKSLSVPIFSSVLKVMLRLMTLSTTLSTTLLMTISMTASATSDVTSTENIKTQLQQMIYPIYVPYQETETRFEDDEKTTTVALITPDTDPNWKLISVNGQTPSKKDIKNYKKKIEKQIEDNEKDPLSSILNVSTLQIFESKEDETIYAFDPLFSDFNDDASKNLTGRVFVNMDNKITRIEINAPFSFSPVFGAKINRFSINYNLDYYKQKAYITDYELDINIKIGGFKTLEMQAEAMYTDLKW